MPVDACSRYTLKNVVLTQFSLMIIFSQYYEDWSFLMDQERSSMLPDMAAGRIYHHTPIFVSWLIMFHYGT